MKGFYEFISYCYLRVESIWYPLLGNKEQSTRPDE
jgi:hypothetical protein